MIMVSIELLIEPFSKSEFCFKIEFDSGYTPEEGLMYCGGLKRVSKAEIGPKAFLEWIPI